METAYLAVQAQLSGPVRRETLNGVPYRVVPATLVRSQILHNNLGKTYLPPEAITPEWAAQANDAPVVIDHPTKRGVSVSARDPEVLNHRGVGRLYGVRAENGALKGDVWLAENAVTPGIKDIFAALDAGTPVENSTGFPVMIEETPGVLNGATYDRVIRPMGFDHLAVFSDKVGACSVTDGCGLGVNHSGACQVGNDLGDPPCPDVAVNEPRWRDFLSRAFAKIGLTKPEPEDTTNSGEKPADSHQEGSMDRDQMIAHLVASARLTREDAEKTPDAALKALCESGSDSEAWKIAHRYRAENEELKARYEGVQNEREQRRAAMLDDLLFNARDLPYGDAELKAMDFEQVEKTHKLAFPNRPNFGARGMPQSTNAAPALNWIQSVNDVLAKREAN